ncbi:putative RNA recognition motif domain, nucleotide-binding alpha-beta plait domain superfamily [Helianthus debilis subsp. tardiflorus]
MAEEHLDFGDEEFGGSQKMQYHGDGAIPALADDEIVGEDDEYDDLYNDVNVGENFLQMQRAELLPSANAGNGKFHDQKPNVVETRPETQPEPMSQDLNINTNIPKPVYPSTGLSKEGLTVDLSQKRMVPQVSNDTGFHAPQNSLVEPVLGPVGNESGPMLNSNISHDPAGVGGPQMPGHQMGVNQVRPPADNGATTLFVGELHWWTTDAELENVLSQYGRVKEIKFFDERASGKSKGYCQVDFYDSGSAAACKDGMNGYVFNGRPCVVAFASPQTIRQMGASYEKKHREERDPDRDRDRYNKDYKYKEEKDSYRDHHRQKDRTTDYDDDWEHGGQSSTRSRSRSRAMPAEDDHHHRSRSRDADYGKRRRMRSD